MQIHRIEFDTFSDRLLETPHYLDVDNTLRQYKRPGVRVIKNPRQYSRELIFQCKLPRLAQKVKHDLRLEWASTSTFASVIPQLDYSDHDLGPVLELTTAPVWHEFKPWLEGNLVGDITATLGMNYKRLSFDLDEDYTLTKLMFT